MTNPYQTPDTSEQLETERMVVIDPVTGATITIGARVERITTDASGGQRRDVMHIVAPSADGEHLLFPYKRPLAACVCCGVQPLLRPFRCANCNRPMCAACRIVEEDVVFCRECGRKSLLRRFLEWLTKL